MLYSFNKKSNQSYDFVASDTCKQQNFKYFNINNINNINYPDIKNNILSINTNSIFTDQFFTEYNQNNTQQKNNIVSFFDSINFRFNENQTKIIEIKILQKYCTTAEYFGNQHQNTSLGEFQKQNHNGVFDKEKLKKTSEITFSEDGIKTSEDAFQTNTEVMKPLFISLKQEAEALFGRKEQHQLEYSEAQNDRADDLKKTIGGMFIVVIIIKCLI